MIQFLNLVLPGMVTGAIYSIMAAGLVLTYQTSGIFNFAHAGSAFATAYVYYQLHTAMGLPVAVSLVLSVLIFAPLMGLALDRILLRRLRSAPMYARIVATVGLLVALPNLMQWLVEVVLIHTFGVPLGDVGKLSAASGLVVPPGIGPTPAHTWRLGFIGLDSVIVTSDQVVVFVAAALSAIVLYLVLRKTRLGLQMRALVDRESLASLRGINPVRTSAVAWAISMVLAGLGGVLIAPLFQLENNTFQFVVLGSLAAVAAAGFRSLPWAFAAGLGLGVVQNLVVGYRGVLLPGVLQHLSGLNTSVPFVLTLVILLVSSRQRRRAAGSVAEETPRPDYRTGMPAWRRRLPWLLVTVAILVFTFGFATTYQLTAFVAPGLAYGMIFLSFVVVTGLGGMISLAQASFVTAGGLLTGWLLQKDIGLTVPLLGTSSGSPNFLVASLLGAAAAALLGALIALAVRRLGPVPLALGTLTLAFGLAFLVFSIDSVSNSGVGWGVRGASWNAFGLYTFHFDVDSDGKPLVVLLLLLFGLISLLIHNIQRGATGRAMFAVRSSEVAARTSGIAPWKSQVALFALSAGIAGFGGAWLGMTSFSATPSMAPPLIGLFWIAVVVTMGVRRPGGALIAGLFTAAGPYLLTELAALFGSHSTDGLLTSPYFLQALAGLGAIQLAGNPDGILALAGHKRAERRRAKERRAHIKAAEARLGVPDDEPPAVSVDEALTGAGSAGDRPVVLVDRVTAGYGDVEVLHDVSLTVGPGEVIALLGANGAGKSTLCSVVAGALPVTSGRIVLNGVDVSAAPAPARVRGGMLLVPEARGVFPGLSVEENLKVLLPSRSDRLAIYQQFPILEERSGKPAGVLSGGEQQLLSLAPVLRKPPALLIADEPTLGLAPLAAEAVIQALSAIQAEGTAILLAEERASEIMGIATRVAVMDLGRVTWAGPAERCDEELLAAAYLK